MQPVLDDSILVYDLIFALYYTSINLFEADNYDVI